MNGTRTRRRSVFGGFTAVAGLCALVASLAIMDERVRDEISRVVSGHAPSGEIVTLGAQAQDMATVLIQAARDHTMAHAPLVIFAVAALVLVLFMTRT
jgi:hypothetical protein